MKLLRPVLATFATEGVIFGGLRLFAPGFFPVMYLAIEAWDYGFLVLAGAYFLLTWGLLVVWLAIVNRGAS